MFIKAIFKDSKKFKKIMYQNVIYIDTPWLAKFTDFRWKNAGVSRTADGVCHVILTFFGCSLGEVELCQL